MSLPAPVIVIPGITATALRDEYELPPEEVWTTFRTRRYQRIALHPRDRRYEIREPARVAASHLFPLVYEDLIEELREDLSPDEDKLVPVFPFAYDWRAPLQQTEAQLAEFIQEVIDRTKLQPHYRSDGFLKKPTVNLVGHSMGGLIVAGYLQAFGGEYVEKVVTLASPFQGSYEAILKVATGTADFGSDSGKARERRAARVTPALYHLLPSFKGALSVPEGMNDDIFDSEVWQPNVIQSIAQYIRRWEPATDDGRAKSEAEAHVAFKAMLREARIHRMRIDGLDLKTVGLETDDWLAVIGVDAETRVGLKVGQHQKGGPRFLLKSSERKNEWDSEVEDERYDTGDGTVPLRGAIPPFLDRSNLVCIAPRDFGYWEWRDRIGSGSGFAGFHGMIPNMNMLHRLISRFLKGTSDKYGSTWGRCLPGVEPWIPPLDLQEKK
jgi:pimeloyl-ACP methyl ester carboxylesterase